MGGAESVDKPVHLNGGQNATSSQCAHCRHAENPEHNAPVHEQQVVVIPVDAGTDSLRAFTWYVANMHRPDHRVHIIHCCEMELPSGKHYPDYAIPPEQWEERLTSCKSLSYQILRHYEEQMKEREIQGTVSTKIGRPGKTVVESARELNACMIVMGSRGLSPLARQVLGSVSQYVLQKSHVPVTVVPPPQKLNLLWHILHKT